MSNRHKYLGRQWLYLVTKKTKHTEVPLFFFLEDFFFIHPLRISCNIFWASSLQPPPPFTILCTLPSLPIQHWDSFYSLPIKSSLYFLASFGTWSLPGVWSAYQGEENWLLSVAIKYQEFLSQWCFMSSFPLLGWDFILLDLWRSCACYHNCCGFICASFLVCLENNVFLMLSTTSCFYNLSKPLFHEDSLSLREECCDRNVLFGADHSTVFCSLHIDKLCVCGGVYLCVNCHQLQVEASLMRTERCSYVQVQQ